MQSSAKDTAAGRAQHQAGIVTDTTVRTSSRATVRAVVCRTAGRAAGREISDRHNRRRANLIVVKRIIHWYMFKRMNQKSWHTVVERESSNM
jgi:hypothetical protein